MCSDRYGAWATKDWVATKVRAGRIAAKFCESRGFRRQIFVEVVHVNTHGGKEIQFQCTCTSLHVYIYITHVCRYASMCLCMSLCECVCVRTCVCMYVCARTKRPLQFTPPSWDKLSQFAGRAKSSIPCHMDAGWPSFNSQPSLEGHFPHSPVVNPEAPRTALSRNFFTTMELSSDVDRNGAFRLEVRETYGMNNHVHFPNENLLGARPLPKEKFAARKLFWGVFWLTPRPVEPIPNRDIYVTLLNHCPVFGLNLRLSGKPAESFLREVLLGLRESLELHYQKMYPGSCRRQHKSEVLSKASQRPLRPNTKLAARGCAEVRGLSVRLPQRTGSL